MPRDSQEINGRGDRAKRVPRAVKGERGIRGDKV